jgi:hypothetical protein
MAQLPLPILKTFQATLEETPIAGFRSAKTQALLAYLAVESARPHSRAVLVGLLGCGDDAKLLHQAEVVIAQPAGGSPFRVGPAACATVCG